MDRITANLLKVFKQEHGITAVPDSRAFEHFANYCVVSAEHAETFSLDDVSVGDGNDAGIDGVAILVNGCLVTSREEVRDLRSTNSYVEAHFIFIQAKRSSSFSGADIQNFCFGVNDFLGDAHKLPFNERLEEAWQIQLEIYENSTAFSKGKPRCSLYFVTTGRWTNDTQLATRIDACTKDLEELGVLSKVTFNPVDADALHALYQDTKNRVTATFAFPKRTVLPPINGVSVAFVGTLPASEYLKLVTDDAGRIRKSLFYDNIRDFQDYNEVNKQIRETIRSPNKDRFAVLNNGVTIVAKSLNTVGDDCVIEDYQVVNGCQTSHVLFNESAEVEDNIAVPIKLVVTTDDGITNAIIRATNTQTAVRSDQLLALSDYQKKLEAYFGTFEGRQKLYYERRSRQYAGSSGVEKVRIVTLPALLRSYTAMFLEEPHRVGRSPSKLLEEVGIRIMAQEHLPEPYYVSAYALYKLEYLFRSSQVSPKHKPARYPLLLAFGRLATSETRPAPTARKMKGYCDGITKVLWDDDKAMKVFEKAVAIVEEVADIEATNNPTARRHDLFRPARFTKALKARLSL